MIIARIPKECSQGFCNHNHKGYCYAEVPETQRPPKETFRKPLDFSKIAFIGQMGAGKDYVASLLGRDYFRVAFGDPIRLISKCIRDRDFTFASAISEALFPSHWSNYSIKDIISQATKIVQTVKDRELLQYLGTEYRRIKDDVWISYGIKKTLEEQKVVITDCRRMNELEALKKAGFIFIYVEADKDTRLERLMRRDQMSYEEFVKASQHVAESEIGHLKDYCEFVIENSKYSNVRHQLTNILNGKVSKRDLLIPTDNKGAY